MSEQPTRRKEHPIRIKEEWFSNDENKITHDYPSFTISSCKTFNLINLTNEKKEKKMID